MNLKIITENGNPALYYIDYAIQLFHNIVLYDNNECRVLESERINYSIGLPITRNFSFQMPR